MKAAEDSRKTESVAALASVLNRETLPNLPPDLLDQLRHAILDGENDQLDKLIGIVVEHNAPLAAALRDLADRYEYDRLTQLLEQGRP